MCKILTKNIKLCGSWSLSNFSIFRTNFSEIIELCPNLGIKLCINLVLPNYKKNHFRKANFNLAMRNTFRSFLPRVYQVEMLELGSEFWFMNSDFSCILSLRPKWILIVSLFRIVSHLLLTVCQIRNFPSYW